MNVNTLHKNAPFSYSLHFGDVADVAIEAERVVADAVFENELTEADVKDFIVDNQETLLIDELAFVDCQVRRSGVSYLSVRILSDAYSVKQVLNNKMRAL